MRKIHISLKVFLPLILFMTVLGSVATGEEYIIGKQDVLKISFWQDPELDQTVMVRQDGKITLSIIGDISAAGMTTSELAGRIESNVSLYNKKISQATVTVIKFNSRKVFVSGQIGFPGKRTFEVIPDIWTVIKEAGGITIIGDLSRITIIRSKETGGEIITVNVLEAIASGKIDELPKLQSGDTIEIPKMPGGVPGRQLASEYQERKRLYYVLGQVNVPGVKAYEEEIDFLDALGIAGGMTPMADLKNIRIVGKNGDGSTIIKIDLNKYTESGQAHRYQIKPEDVIIVGEKRRRFIGWGTIRDLVTIAGTVISFVYLIDRR